MPSRARTRLRLYFAPDPVGHRGIAGTADNSRQRRRIIRKFTIDYITVADPTYPGHQLVTEAFAKVVDALARRPRPLKYLEAESAFGLIADEYWNIVGKRGKRVRGVGRWKRRRADAFIYSHIQYVRMAVPAHHRLRDTGRLSIADAMATAFDCGQREIEQAWSRREFRKKRSPRVVKR